MSSDDATLGSAGWDHSRVPRLVIRCETGDFLLPDTLTRMQASGVTALEVPLTGRAPAMLDLLPIEAIRSFLSG